jgi:hypothetical protein
MKQLVKEKPQMAKTFGNKSVAEQNSINLAWQLLMESRFSNLRAAIYHSSEERTRFKQLVVNSVLATGKLLLHRSVQLCPGLICIFLAN